MRYKLHSALSEELCDPASTVQIAINKTLLAMGTVCFKSNEQKVFLMQLYMLPGDFEHSAAALADNLSI